MTLSFDLNNIAAGGIKSYDARREKPGGAARFYRTDEWRKVKLIPAEKTGISRNMLVMGDNLDFMEFLIDNRGMAGKIDLIYIDPPFFSGVNNAAYKDKWESGVHEYLKEMTERLIYMRELLNDTGSIFIHLDWHIVHYVKAVADGIFGMQNFVNEIVWQYKSGGAGKRHFGRKHDTILFYAKTKKYKFFQQKEKSYNRGLRPYRFKGIKEYRDEVGWHTVVNMKDVWQIDMVGRTAKERVDYPTQKPEALLERIIRACSEPGDLCADFFAGSGTLAATADRLGRQWICCDNGRLAIDKMKERLRLKSSEFDYYEEKGSISED